MSPTSPVLPPIFARWMSLLAFFLALFVGQGNSLAVVSAGGVAIIGYNDFNGSITVVALQALSAGEDIYFTNNGWSSSSGAFNGAADDQGAGNESLIKLSTTGVVPKGTVISSTITGSNFVWASSGVIPGTTNGTAEFSNLILDPQSDQIYAFQAQANNPLLNPSNFIYALHFGDVDNPVFADASDTLSGDVPPGLSETAHTAFAQTNLGFHGDGDGNHSSWGLNMSSPQISSLQLDTGHKEDWLAAIANSSNWSEGQPSIAKLSVAPEPTRTLLLAMGAAGLLLRRSRRSF